MASPKFSILLLALMGAVISFMQVAVADEVVDVGNGDGVTTSPAVDSSKATDLDFDHDDAEAANENDFSTTEADSHEQSEAADLNEDDPESDSEDPDFVEDPEAATDVPDDDSESSDVAEGDDQSEATDLADDDDISTVSEGDEELSHPLARILAERSSRRCHRKQSCKRYFKTPGCCKKRCVNVATDSTNCGKCRHRCNTGRGYFCKHGKCKKFVPPVQRCSRRKRCHFGKTCCSGKCASLTSDTKNCGSCRHKCRNGKACCNGQCKNILTNSRNCGGCGRHVPFGKVCCHGKFVNLSRDKNNCGRCGNKCRNSNCRFGLCGY